MNKLIYFVLGLMLTLVLAIFGCASMGSGGVPIEELRTKANQGNPAAQFQLGIAYDIGQNVIKNQSAAASWYRKAAEQGYAAAQNSLGSMYQYGEGVPKDNNEAIRWYQKAADQDYGESYTNLGYMYDCGFGVKEDKEKAVNLYRSGVEKGSLNAMLNLGMLYWKGDGVSKDLVQAHMWFDLVRFYTQHSPNMQLKWRVRDVLDEVKKEMTKEQIKAAKKLSQEWDAAHQGRYGVKSLERRGSS